MTALGPPRSAAGLIYRLHAGVKLLAMLIFGVAVLSVSHRWMLAAALLIGACTVLWVRIPLMVLWANIRPFVAVIAILSLIQAWQHGWAPALELASTTLALILAALIVTATTPSDAILDAITAACRPLRPLGVNPDRIGLSFSLMLRAIEHISSIARQTRQAAKARGLERNLRAQLTPLVIRTVGHAQATGEALTARGIGDEEPKSTSGAA